MRKKSSTIVEFRIPIWNTIVFGEIKKNGLLAQAVFAVVDTELESVTSTMSR